MGGDQFEQGSFTDKNAAIEDTVASYHALSDHDKKKLDSIM